MIRFVIFLRDIKMTLQRILGALVLGLCVSSANAAVVSVSQSLSIDQYLNGSSRGYSFDLNDSLAAKGVRSGDVFAGALTVSGYSGLDAFSFTIGYRGPYLLSQETRNVTLPYLYIGKCGWLPCLKTGYSTSTVTDTHYGKEITFDYRDNVKDTMVVSAGGSSASDQADDYSEERWESEYLRILALGSFVDGFTTYDLRKVITESGYSGSLLAQLTLDAGALSDVRDDGLFSFVVNAPGLSQFTIDEARLDLLALLPDVVDPALSGDVPEPATFGLIGGALGMLALARRRRVR